MKNGLKGGPTILEQPRYLERVCNGCSFLNTGAAMRGHKTVTNNFSCGHPEFKNERMLFSNVIGKTIHFNHEGNCQTPDWCPYLTSQKNTL